MSELTLRQKQSLLVKLVAELVTYATEKGYELTYGDAYRDPRVFGPLGTTQGYGRASSNHKIRLAVDFNLFKDGKWLRNTEDHRELGEFWESLHPLCKWGGRFKDGNHYSLVHNGRR